MSRPLPFIVAVLASWTASPLFAQHQDNQMPAPPAQTPAAQAAAAPGCVQGAQKALTIVSGANAGRRRAATRAELRRSIEQMSAATRSAQTQLAGCAVVQSASVPVGSGAPEPLAPTMDHAKMKMAGRGASRPPDAGAPMDHSKMKMPAASATSAKQPIQDGATPAPVDHSKMNMGGRSGQTPGGMEKTDPRLPVMPAERVMDPACPTFDLPTAPKAAFDRKVYYFCSDNEREEFRRDPAAYLKKRPRG